MICYISITILFLFLCIPYFIFHKPGKPNLQHPYDMILVLGCPANEDGTLSLAQFRRIKAASLYVKQGFSDHVVLSGGAVKNEIIEAQIMADALQDLLKDHPCKISLETNAHNTYQNMKFTKAEFPCSCPLIVTGSSHRRRSYFFAKKFFEECAIGSSQQRDPFYYVLWEYTRMWVALYWEIKLSINSSFKGH